MQIQNAVEGYRTQLQAKGLAADQVQGLVWRYYKQCVQSCYTQNQPGVAGGAGGSSPGASSSFLAGRSR